jgi:hypothetical protein
MTILLDALAALDLLTKENGRYRVPESAVPLLGLHGPGSVLAMVQHQASMLRRWSRLSEIVKTGKQAERVPGVRGEDADYESFVIAMDNVSAPVADEVISALKALEFNRVLDIGGASGTWTLAFLRMTLAATATLFDLPHVIPLAEKRIAEAELTDRVTLVGGDFYTDPLPTGADLAWISAIVHQNSREQNRLLFDKVHKALTPGGMIAIRDIVMKPDRTLPAWGALFAVNMLVGTEAGGTFTFEELQQDLEAAQFTNVSLLRRDQLMNAIIVAKRIATD